MRRGFVVHHNGPPAACIGEPHTRCERFWRAVRDFHVDTKGWSDIAYSFGVCPHGIRFEGRGWSKTQWANGTDQVGPDDGGDRYWYTVLVFLGGDEKPTAEMVEGVKELIQEGRDWGRCMDRVLPHNAFKVKPCPGPEFTAYAKAWDNQPLTAAPAIATPVVSQEDDDMPTVYALKPNPDGTQHPDAAATHLVIGNVREPIPNPSYHDAAVAEWGPVKYVSGAAWDLLRARTSLGISPLIDLTKVSDDDIEAIAKAVNDEMHRRSAD